MAERQAYREPLRATLLRTVGIAVAVGAIIALSSRDIRRWPAVSLVLLWPSFGGHWVDLWYLNWLRPRLPAAQLIQRGARIAAWFAGGVLLGFGVRITANLLFAHPRLGWLTWASAGVAFVAIELAAHAALHLRDRPNFYDGAG
jgi:hypothetical protein